MEEPQILPTSAIKQNYSKLLWLTELSFMVKAQGIPIPAPIWSKILVMPYSPWVTYLFSVWPHIKLILNYINSSNSIWVKHRLEQNKVVFFPLTQLIFSLEKCFYEHVYVFSNGEHYESLFSLLEFQLFYFFIKGAHHGRNKNFGEKFWAICIKDRREIICCW